ncbi:hypothetical protein OIU34_20275 [Pararhizobium sp. BT-229]|uniref:hypothetical protein n=1 Tax=Pararhizobium sp. BT-229 TaxID=2986923 RepID=UPI0021F71BAF|nr:hypothetical protein [Pararhizobium sp. BT-229]MCV9964225.1 hypothetical protein [Pararhizobium sp. BT-229]
MKIQLPFIYWAEVVVGRKRNADTLNYLGVVEAEIPEITPDMAPVVVSWDSSNSANRAHQVRTFDGGFVVPAAKLQRDALRFPASMLANVSNMDEDAARGVSVMLGHKLGEAAWHDLAKYTGPKASDVPQTKDIKTLVSSGEESARAAAEEVAAGLVSIDRILFRRVDEPVIAVSNHLWRGTPRVSVSIHTGSRRFGAPIDLDEGIHVSDPLNTKFFPLADIGRALDAAHSFGNPVDVQIDGEPEVLIPSVFAFDPEFDAAARTAEYAVEGLKSGIARFDRPTIECWVDIRERFRAYQQSGDRSIIEDLASQALQDLYEMVGRVDHGAAAAIEAGLGDWGEGTINVALFGEGLKR